VTQIRANHKDFVWLCVIRVNHEHVKKEILTDVLARYEASADGANFHVEQAKAKCGKAEICTLSTNAIRKEEH
jgi:hypothetical protein